jgi:hypothetical protein
VGLNLWLEPVIDAYLLACAQGRDWREAVAAAEQIASGNPLCVVTQKDLKSKKGVKYSRQHLHRKVRSGTFPAPFQLPAIQDP